jgi:DNA-binding response OmpR family regulator
VNRTVLIVEDDLDLREAIGEILEHDRFHVMHAAHGAEAIDILRTSSELPGLILLDLMMPIMNGVQFRAIQRNDPRLAAIPVVVMSAVTDGERKASSLQPAAFLPKPADREHILAVVRRFFQGRGLAGVARGGS